MTKRELVRVISTRFTDGLPPKFLRNLISQPIVDLAKLNFRQHLSYLVLATALPLLALSLVLFGRMVHAEREATRTGLMTNVRTMASLVDNEVSDHAAIAATLAHSSALKRGDLATFWQEAKEALDFVPDAWLSLSDPSGKILLHTLREYGADIGERRDLEGQTKAFATGKPYLSDLMTCPISKRLAAHIYYPIFKDGHPLYAIGISLAPSRFLALIENKFMPGQAVGVLDRHWKFAARIPDHENRAGTLASQGWREAMSQASEGVADVVTLEGDPTYTAYTTTAEGWTVGASVKLSILNGPVRQIFWAMGILAVALVVLSLQFAYLLSKRFTVSMAALTSGARDLGAGKKVEIPALKFREARIIGQALSDASVELKEREAALKQFNAELEDKVRDRTSELVAEMKRREESEAKARQMQKMEAIGQLAGGIAHDFNNMMAVVLGSLDLFERRSRKGDTDTGHFIESAKQGAERAASLTKRLLAFSRQQALSPQEIDVNRLIPDISDLIRRTIPESIQIETVLAGGIWKTYADPNQLENVLLNLVSNARDAMPAGGRLTIETANAHLDDAYAASNPEVEPGQYVLVAVTDTGPGMPPDVASKAFEPFFTTKPVGKGTGLGLSQVYGFVKQTGGHVKIYNESGHGVSVKVYLPRSVAVREKTFVESPARTARLPLSRSNELILVVEDEPAVLQLSSRMLSELGYRTLEASGAVPALTLLDANPDIAVLFTDVVMPDMNGRQLAAAARQRRPDLKVLFTTGYTRNAIVHNGVLDADVDLILKPFAIDALALKLDQILKRAAQTPS